MRTAVLEYLACPLCQGNLVADTEPPAPDGHILNGVLVCGCGERYPIRDGVPRLLADIDDRAPQSEPDLPTERFAVRWGVAGAMRARYEQQFLDWVTPLTPRDFTNRTVLEAGACDGTHTRLAARYGPRALVALEPGPAVDFAFAATRHLKHAHVVQGNLERPPVGRAFDIALSVGALHFLAEPEEAFRAITSRVAPGGRVAVWVQGHESNEFLVRLVDPVRRRITSRLPRPLLYWTSLPPAVALTAAIQAYRLRPLAEHLPLGDYLSSISWYTLRDIHQLVFRELAASVTHYLREENIRAWFEEADFEGIRIDWHNGNSWRASARVIDSSAKRASRSAPAS